MSSVKNVINDSYKLMLLKDYLREAIKEAGFSEVDIQKTPTGTRVGLHVTRPGIVIGRKGSGIRDLTKVLETDFGLKNPQISVIEITKPELEPSVMCNRMSQHLARGTAFRRAVMWTMQTIMEAGAMGVQITTSGKLRGDRSSFEKHSKGILPRAGHQATVIVSEDIVHVQTKMGLIGVRIRIARKERFIPEFELKVMKKEAKQKVEVPEEIEIVEETQIDPTKPRTESEVIELEEKLIETVETFEEVEEELK
ncbi:MAG: 30S ribosomal protein S3 [Thaumarchaeota archaeon]|jgi:small subunit ribosomal protein S3|nr:30S ribosomal protein S3 [Nitrososphaerota archaeon]